MKEFIQEELTPAQAYFIASDKKFLWFCAGRGCFAKDTDILMFNGTSKKVQDIKIGDSIMGDDYTERIVLKLCFGEEPIYRVKLEDNSYFDCNESHECVVFNRETGKIEEKKIIDLIGNENLYYHIKKASPEKTISLYKFKINKEKERDSYYGFTLSGNNRFILANSMIITKNSGKCFSPDTDFLMYDGTIKNVKDLKVGDELMGYDSNPRKILSLTSGYDQMYEIKPKKGDSHVVNSSHILTLKHNNPTKSQTYIYDISLKDYLKNKESTKNKLSYLFSEKINFKEQETDLDPYIFGVWLGDGTSSCVELTSIDHEVIDYWRNYFKKFDFLHEIIRDKDNENKTNRYGFFVKKGGNKPNNPILNLLRKGLNSKGKFIPQQYLINSEEKRLELLAGLIDTDGYLANGSYYEITTKHNDLKDGILFLSRSLGFTANARVKTVKIREGYYKQYWRINILGDIYKIPCKIERKKAKPKKKRVNQNLKKFDVIECGYGEYYGFTVEGDGRIVLSDFTVTHNTTVGSRWIYGKVIKYPRARGIICANTYQQLHAATLPPVLAYFREIGLKYTVNKRPPDEWLQRTPFQAADYKNILVVETGAHIFLRSLDNPEYIRGIEYGWGWIDEISSTTKDAWDIVIGGLRDKESLERHIRVTGTPDGDNWTWREFKKKWSTDPKAAAQFDIVFMSTRENPFIEPDLLDSMLASYDRRKALQEIDGRILTDQEANIYYEWRPIYHLKELVPYDPGKPLILCWDFNAGKEAPMSMVIAQQHNFSNGQPFVQVLDEIVILGGNTPKVCEEFLRRYYSHHRSNIYIYGDSTGRSRASTVGVNDYQMILDILKPKFHNEVYLRIPTKNMLEVDRRASMNAMFLNSKGEIRMFVSPNCKELIKDFDELTPDTHGKINKKDPSRSHTSDALGYYIAREFPVFSKQAKSFELNLNLMQR